MGTARSFGRYLCVCLILTTVLSLFSSGCLYSSIQPRTADLGPQGGTSMGLNVNLYSTADGKVELPSGEIVEGNSGFRSEPVLPFLALFAPVYNSELSFRHAVYNGLEIGALLGLQQIGMEMRVAALDEDRGAPFSLAPSMALNYRPFTDTTSVWIRGGFDVSRRIGSVAPFIDVYVSHGPESHLFSSDDFETEPCSSDDWEFCGLQITRTETRLTGAIGIALFRDGSNYDYMTLAISPHYTISTGDDDEIVCENCEHDPGVVSLSEDYGIHFTFGISGLLD